jgi:hypothetical protein
MCEQRNLDAAFEGLKLRVKNLKAAEAIFDRRGGAVDGLNLAHAEAAVNHYALAIKTLHPELVVKVDRITGGWR